MKKLITILCIIAVPAIAQKMPQKTFYRGEIQTADTVGKSDLGYLVRLMPSLIYYYNSTDSIYVSPICYIPNEMTPTQFPCVYAFQVDVFKDLGELKNGEFKITTPKCEEHQTGDLPEEYRASLILNNPSPVYEKNYGLIGATMMHFRMVNYQFGFTSMCGTKEIELTINGKIIVPKQNREASDYLTKVNEHISWMVIK